ncbi:MAG: DegV family protein [Anaerolineales bacterium]|nr:DegV family protein [Anaerolineales bacterium]
MLRIVTDGAADMPPGWEQEYDIQVVPINIHFREHTYLQGVDLSNEGFYRLVDESGTIPKTSQPTPFQFKALYKRIARAGDTILSLHVTSRLSGTFDSAVSAARDLGEKFRLYPFDSGSGSAALGMMCREARLLDQAGASIHKILERMEEIRRNVSIVLTLGSLRYARMSGRVGTLQAALASMLDVKPIVVLCDGVLEMAERVRTRGRAINRLVELLQARFDRQPVNVAAVHARDPRAAEDLLIRARKLFNVREAILTDLSIAVAANLGPGTVGLVIYPAGE